MQSMRLDKFLKLSRIIKRRTVANEACDNSYVSVNGRAAKASHDALEKVYNGSVDFGGVYALAEREWDRIAGWL